jgi:hypothetical protein
MKYTKQLGTSNRNPSDFTCITKEEKKNRMVALFYLSSSIMERKKKGS